MQRTQHFLSSFDRGLFAQDLPLRKYGHGAYQKGDTACDIFGCRFMILMHSITYYSEADDIEPLNPIHNALECIDRTTDKKRYSRTVREN